MQRHWEEQLAGYVKASFHVLNLGNPAFIIQDISLRLSGPEIKLEISILSILPVIQNSKSLLKSLKKLHFWMAQPMKQLFCQRRLRLLKLQLLR